MKLLAILLLVISVLPVSSQRLRYKDVMEAVRTRPIFEYLPMLNQYQSENANEANVYFQLARTNEKLLKTYDPILDQEKINTAIYNIGLYYGLVKGFADDKEFKKNYEDYFISKDSSDYDFGIMMIDNRIRSAEKFSATYKIMYDHYEKSVQLYDSCLSLFTSINEQANNLRELYLKADDDLIREIKAVGNLFEQSLFNHAQFKKTIKTLYPTYEAGEIKLEPISLYRMNGLTQSNFLSSPIYLWDYKTWSDEFLDQLITELEALRNELNTNYQNYEYLARELGRLENSLITSQDSVKLNPRLFNLVRKYDNNSGLVELFQFCQAELNYYLRASHPFNFPEESQYSIRDMSSIGRYYQSLYNQFEHADSMVSVVDGLSFDAKFNSFIWFIEEYYKDLTGFKIFLRDRKENNAKLFTKSIRNYTTYIEGIEKGIPSDELFSSQKLEKGNILVVAVDTLPKYSIEKKYRLDSADLLTVGRLFQEDTSYFLARIQTINDTSLIKWEYTFMADAMPLVRFNNDSTVIFQDTKGLQLFNGQNAGMIFPNNKFEGRIVSIDYNDLFREYTIINEDTINETSNIVLRKLSQSGKEELVVPMNYEGSFLKKIILNNQNVLFFSGTNRNNRLYSITVDEGTGQVIDTLFYQGVDFFPKKLIKLNDEFLNVLGSRKPEHDTPIDTYTLFNYDGRIEEKYQLYLEN